MRRFPERLTGKFEGKSWWDGWISEHKAVEVGREWRRRERWTWKDHREGKEWRRSVSWEWDRSNSRSEALWTCRERPDTYTPHNSRCGLSKELQKIDETWKRAPGQWKLRDPWNNGEVKETGTKAGDGVRGLKGPISGLWELCDCCGVLYAFEVRDGELKGSAILIHAIWLPNEVWWPISREENERKLIRSCTRKRLKEVKEKKSGQGWRVPKGQVGMFPPCKTECKRL